MSTEPVLVVGARGMLGRAFLELFAREGVDHLGVDLGEIDAADRDSVSRVLEPRFRTVLNCAAFTDVDGAEVREADALRVNATAVEVLGARCRETGALLVHFSTDYVFDGRATAPYPVDAAIAPQGAYGRTKAAGERALVESGASHLLVRTSWLYAPWAKNFVLTIAKAGRERDVLRVVDDQRGRPTEARHLARSTWALRTRGAEGTFHVTDGGECTWFELARFVVGAVGAPARVEPCTTAELARPAPRPAYSVLDLAKTEALLGPMPPWQDAVTGALADAGLIPAAG